MQDCRHETHKKKTGNEPQNVHGPSVGGRAGRGWLGSEEQNVKPLKMRSCACKRRTDRACKEQRDPKMAAPHRHTVTPKTETETLLVTPKVSHF